MKKRILFVTKALWIGGIEIALVNLLNSFNYDKYDVTLLITRAELDMIEQINSQCKVVIIDRDETVTFQESYKYRKLFHLTEKTDSPSRFHQAMMWTVPIIKWVENRLYIQYIKNMMKNEHFDTVIIYSDAVAELTVRAIKANKYLMFYHHGAMRHVYHDIIAYKKCEKIIAVSQNIAEELKLFVPKYAHKIISIHNLTDINGIKDKGQITCEDIFDSTKINIVSVGRISREKGMDLAVCACRKLIEDGFENINWWVVGGGPAMKEVLDKIEELKMGKYMKMVGMKSNPYPYIKHSDLYVQPSRVEAFGLTIKEAMVLGKKIIATNTAGAREILVKDQDGVLCNINSTSLAKAIEQWICSSRGMESDKSNVNEFEQENFDSLKRLEDII